MMMMQNAGDASEGEADGADGKGTNDAWPSRITHRDRPPRPPRRASPDISLNIVTALARSISFYLPICPFIMEEAMNCYEQTACCSGTESNVRLL